MFQYKPHEQVLLLEAYGDFVTKVDTEDANNHIDSFLAATNSIELSISLRLIGLMDNSLPDI